MNDDLNNSVDYESPRMYDLNSIYRQYMRRDNESLAKRWLRISNKDSTNNCYPETLILYLILNDTTWLTSIKAT